jgi:hypothetical protein
MFNATTFITTFAKFSLTIGSQTIQTTRDW